MIATHVKDHLDDIRKSELFNVQKLQLKEAMTANDIARDALDAFHYSVYSIAFLIVLIYFSIICRLSNLYLCISM